jgi:O-antigen/teichoic acid export membrane protein
MTPISSQGFKRYFVNTSWLMGHRVLSMVVALFVGVYVARYLGPERFGLLSYAGSFVGLFTALATLGLDGIMVRELVKTPERKDELLGTAFWLKAGGAIFMWAGIAAAVPFTNNDTQTNILIVIIAFAIIFQAFNVIDLNYQAEVKSKYVVYAQLVSLVISSITKLVFVWIAAPLVWFACVFLLDAVVHAVGFTAMYLKNTGKIWCWKWNWETAKELLKDSWPLILSGISIAVALRIDQVMIKNCMTASDVGIYSVGVRLAEVFVFIPMIIGQSLWPKLISLDFDKDMKVLVAILRNVFYFLIALSVSVILVSKYVVLGLFGSEYSGSYKVLDILIFTIPATYLGIITNKLLLRNNDQTVVFYKQSALMCCNIFLNIMFIPIYGIIGAAYATLVSDIIINFLFDLVFFNTRWIFRLKIKSLLFI